MLQLSIFAQDGYNDPTFNVTDVGFGNGDGANNYINRLAVQTDGKLLIAGNFTLYNGSSCFHFARLNVDGTLDESFNSNISGVGISGVRSIVFQQDGKIVVGGNIANSALGINHVMRLNSDGTVDSSFIVPHWANDPNGVRQMAIQPDGKIVIAFYDEIIRVQTDGSLDPTFNTGLYVNNDTYAIALQSDGKILIGGQFTNYSGTAVNRLIRILPNGLLDSTFNIGTGSYSSYTPDNYVSKILVLSDNNIIISGGFDNFNSVYIPYIVKLNQDGSINTGFNHGMIHDASPVNPKAAINDFLVQSDGKILVSGKFTSIDGNSASNMARLDSNGTFDNSFISNNVSDNSIYRIAFQGSNIVLVGDFDTCKNVTRHKIARLSNTGLHDISFNTGSGSNGLVYDIATQTDGKILVGGTFTLFNGAVRNGITRLNADGTLDPAFTYTLGVNSSVYTIAVQSDGKILIGGTFTAYGSFLSNKIVRINSDGTLDTSFNIGTGFNDFVREIVIQPDGKIIVIGAFTSYNGVPANRIIRLNSNGSIDSTFNIGTGANNSVSEIALQQDGKILIAGSFSAYNGVSKYRILRLNSNGSLDTTFLSGTGLNTNGAISSINILSDGKILLTGNGGTYNNSSIGPMFRLNQDGTLNTSILYSNSSGADSISDAVVRPDGKIFFTGSFINDLESNTGYVLKLDSNGNIDSNWLWLGNIHSSIAGGGSFFNTSGFGSTIALQSDGKVLIGGNFLSYANAGRNRIARLDAGVLGVESFDDYAGADFVLYNNEKGLNVDLGVSKTINKIVIYDIQGKQIFETNNIYASHYCISSLNKTKQISIIKIEDTNGMVYFKKCVF